MNDLGPVHIYGSHIDWRGYKDQIPFFPFEQACIFNSITASWIVTLRTSELISASQSVYSVDMHTM